MLKGRRARSELAFLLPGLRAVHQILVKQPTSTYDDWESTGLLRRDYDPERDMISRLRNGLWANDGRKKVHTAWWMSGNSPPPLQLATRSTTLRNRAAPSHDLQYDCKAYQMIGCSEENDLISVQPNSDKGFWRLGPFLWKEVPRKRYYIFEHPGKVTIIRLDSLGC